MRNEKPKLSRRMTAYRIANLEITGNLSYPGSSHVNGLGDSGRNKNLASDN